MTRCYIFYHEHKIQSLATTFQDYTKVFFFYRFHSHNEWSEIFNVEFILLLYYGKKNCGPRQLAISLKKLKRK